MSTSTYTWQDIHIIGDLEVTELSQLDLPKPLAAAIKAYEDAWEAWSDADLAHQEAAQAIQEAEDADTAAREKAIVAGKADPGTPRTEAAHAAAIAAQIKARAAAHAVSVHADRVRTLGAEHRAAAIRAAAAYELSLVSDYAARVERAQRELDTATALLVRSGRAFRQAHAATHTGPTVGSPPVSLPTADLTAYRNAPNHARGVYSSIVRTDATAAQKQGA